MKRKNTSGYGTETFTFYIETTEGCYDVTLDVKFFIQAPDYDSWESDQDYHGYTEILDVDITKISHYNEDGELKFISISELCSNELSEIRARIDNILEQTTFGE